MPKAKRGGSTIPKPSKARRKLPRINLLEVARAGEGAELPRLHRGDIMSPETRSAVMARIRGRNTGPERVVRKMVTGLGLRVESHARDLPGRPDLVLRRLRAAIFVDGDFWHGWRFPLWRRKLSEKWELKIAATRRRDASNHAKLRRSGWLVIRIWEHQLAAAPDRVVARLKALLTRKAGGQ
jgi:DNA mismatch endonuclease (patch repair protein)